MSDKKSFRNAGDNQQDQVEVKRISASASVKGIGSQSDPSFLQQLKVTIGPSSLCQFYAEELFDSIEFGISYRTGATNPNIAFSHSDLYAYLCIILRERVRQVKKERTLFSPRDTDIKTPSFFYLMLANVGEVIDERRHLWVELEYNDYDLKLLNEMALRPKVAGVEPEFKLYTGPAFGSEGEKLFCYDMSKQLRLLERYGLVNASALPRDTEGVLDFLLFVWAENRLKNSDPEIEPALSVFASLLSFVRDEQILNPYIPYGGEAAYRALLKDVTVMRNAS